MITRDVVIQNASGFHVRPAQLFVEKAAEFKAKLKVKTQSGAEVDSQSILGLMSLGLEQGAQITLVAEGEDEAEAVDALTALIQSKFGEE